MISIHIYIYICAYVFGCHSEHWLCIFALSGGLGKHLIKSLLQYRRFSDIPLKAVKIAARKKLRAPVVDLRKDRNSDVLVIQCNHIIRNMGAGTPLSVIQLCTHTYVHM